MWRFSTYFCLHTRLIRCLIFYLCLSKIANAYKSTECNLMSNCMYENNLALVPGLENTTCQKTQECELLASNSSSCQMTFHVALERFKVKGNWIQMHLVTSLPSHLKGSFLFQISFGFNTSCYNFVVDSALLSSTKESFVLPCIHFRRHTSFHLFAYYKEANNFELITFQSATYTLEDASEVQVFESGFLHIAPSFDKRYFYLTSSAKEDDSCSFSYKVSIYKSLDNQTCDIEKPVCKFSSVLKTPHRYLRCPWNHLKPCQKYCIHTFFRGHEKCKYAYPVNNMQVTFFKVVPPCEDWNASIGRVEQEQGIRVSFVVWEIFKKCFDSYQILLYPEEWDGCDTVSGKPIYNITINQTNEQIDIPINDIMNGNYCVWAIPCRANICYNDWPRHMEEKVFVHGKTSLFATLDSFLSLTTTYVAITLLLLISGIGFWRIAKKKKEIKFQYDTEQMPLEPVIVPLIPTVTYFFHSSDDGDLNKVDILVNYLRYCADLQVYTLRDVLHEILLKQRKWFLRNIQCKCRRTGPPCSSNKRFAILVTDRSLQLVLNSSDHLRMTNVERVFHDSIDYMTRNSHVLKLCFEARFYDYLNDIAGTSWHLLSDRDGILDLCNTLGSTTQRNILDAAIDTHPIKGFLRRERDIS